MSLISVNPFTEEPFGSVAEMTAEQLDLTLSKAWQAARILRERKSSDRMELMYRVAEILRARTDEFAHLITQEMGKRLNEARAEVLKCARVCDYYASHALGFLAPQTLLAEHGTQTLFFEPLGPVLGVMPWNFPFWQVFRCTSANIMAGNPVVIKHAANVPQCAQMIETIFREAGDDFGAYHNLPITSARVAAVISDARIAAVALTGSEPAGRAVSAAAGAALKKCTLELGGSDPFIVLADADLDTTVPAAITARFSNAGQSCISAKRFLVERAIFAEFSERFVAQARALNPGDPLLATTTLAPMARRDQRELLHAQVEDARALGANVLCGGVLPTGSGYFYPATVITGPTPKMRLFCEEVFGPVAVLYEVADAGEAVGMANNSPFGLGASIWTRDIARGRLLARALECGVVCVNEVVKSDPSLPFGGVKQSGFGRELGKAGLLEFVNLKTVRA